MKRKRGCVARLVHSGRGCWGHESVIRKNEGGKGKLRYEKEHGQVQESELGYGVKARGCR